MAKSILESDRKVQWGMHTLPDEEKVRRYATIQQAMKERDIDCLIIAGHHGNYGERNANLRFVANYAPWFDDEYVVFPRDGEPILLTFLIGHADWASRISWIKKIEVTGKAGYVKALSAHLQDLKYGKGTIGICDFETMPTYMYVGLQQALPQVRLINAGDVLSLIRRVKSSLELEFIEKAAECADIGFKAMLATARPGILDTELYIACEQAMIRAEAEPPSFILLSSSQSFREKGFGLPFAGCRRILREGDMILTEISPSYGGYWGQMCSPIVIGNKIPNDLRKVFDIHQEMYQLALAEIRPGVTFGEIHAKVRELGYSLGCDRTPVPWALQPIGSQIIESMSPETVLKPNMTLVVHPAAGHEGAYGGHTAGNTVVVTDKGNRILSKIPFQIHQKAI